MSKRISYIIGAIIVGTTVSMSSVAHAFWKSSGEIFISGEKKITLNDDGIVLNFSADKEDTVGDFLKKHGISVTQYDFIVPALDTKIFSGSTIIIQRAKKVSIIDGSNTIETHTTQKQIENVIWENEEIDFGEDDFTLPPRTALVEDGMKIKITHVSIKEETESEPIAFKTISNEDDSLSWRTKKITQKGENGILQIKYKVVYHNGKEISRKILDKSREKDPVDEIVTQGTHVKVGKTHTGMASWYAYTGTLSAANPWLPMGSYVRVTNRENGKSVIVKINDRGPFGNGRIIDLDKVAFAKIASLGAGVVDVKMEVITN